MARNKQLKDDLGILYQTYKILPEELIKDALKAIAELEDEECHKTRTFPHTQLHKLVGLPKKADAIYECYINKISGWRYQVRYKDNYLELLNISSRKEHDNLGKVVKSKMNRFK